MISHDMNTTFGVGHYVALLHEGRIHASGRPVDIVRSTDPVVQGFIAASGVDVAGKLHEMREAGDERQVIGDQR